MSERKLKLARNPDLIDKNEAGNPNLFVAGWENREETVAEFLEATTVRGEAYTAQLSGSRKSANFQASNVASVDVDHGLSIKQALEHPFIRRHALLLYTTARHSSQSNRYRLVFLLPETVTTAARMRAVNRGLTRMVGGDMAATDAARVYFGHREAQVHCIGGEIGPELLREIAADAYLPENTDLPDREIVSRRSLVALTPDQELRLADGRSMSLRDVPPRTRVHCPIHNDENPSAFIVQSKEGKSGVYCSACSKSYWAGEQVQEDYDPDEFIKAARAVAAAGKLIPPGSAAESSWSLFGPESLTGCRVNIVSGQATPSKLLPGITLVRSDKGTGKTHGVRHLAAHLKTALLIGHRRTLIRGSCRRLGLNCYLDRKKDSIERGKATDDNNLPYLLEDDIDDGSEDEDSEEV
jgi:hypothetical protein